MYDNGGIFQDADNHFFCLFNSAGRGLNSIISRTFLLHTCENIFFQMSLINVDLVTHIIVYCSLSNDFEAVNTAVHVFPVPTECHNNIPRLYKDGVKYSLIKDCVFV